METKVNFLEDADTGNDTNVSLSSVLQAKNVDMSTAYTLNMKIYVPASYMKKGRLFVKSWIDYYDSSDNYIGYAGISDDNVYFDISSSGVTKTGDFYAVDVSMPLEVYYDDNDQQASFPTGTGNASVGVFISAFGMKYTGSLYFDDITLTADGKAVSTVDYEDGKIGSCTYSNNADFDTSKTPKVVSFTGSALTVAKAALTIKTGKTATIKTTTLPSAKATFTSSNKKVATVSSKGVVKGVKKGKATITVKANGKTVKVKVTVK
jgi:hypothetical protein